MKRKVLALILAAVMVAGLVAGCSSSKNDDSADTKGTDAQKEEATDGNETEDAGSAITDEEVTLRMSWWGGDERHEATLQVIEQFEELYPNVTIEAEYGASDGYHDKLATQLASGTAPDIIQIDPEVFPTYVATDDYFVDLMDYDIDMTTFDEAYISLEINGRYDGKQLGLPTGISGAGIIVNQDLADEIGLDFTQPIDWEDLIEMGKQVREYDDSLYLLCANKEYIVNLVVFNYAKQLIGGTVYDEEGNLSLTEEQLAEVFDYVKRLYDEEVVPPASYQAAYSGDDLQSDVNWVNGKYVAALTYISTIDVMVAASPDGNYSMSQLPILDGATEAGWASNTPQLFSIAKTCEHPEIAALFLDYFFNNEVALETLGATRSVPPTERAREICTEAGSLTEVVRIGADIAASMGGTPNDKISSSEEAKAILFDAVENIGYGAATVEAVTADVMNQLSEFSN